MASMNISLPDSLRAWVQARIDSGRYASVSDYVRDLIRHDQELAEQKAQQEAVRQGIADLRAGKTKPVEEALTRLEQKYRDR